MIAGDPAVKDVRKPFSWRRQINELVLGLPLLKSDRHSAASLKDWPPVVFILPWNGMAAQFAVVAVVFAPKRSLCGVPKFGRREEFLSLLLIAPQPNVVRYHFASRTPTLDTRFLPSFLATPPQRTGGHQQTGQRLRS